MRRGGNREMPLPWLYYGGMDFNDEKGMEKCIGLRGKT